MAQRQTDSEDALLEKISPTSPDLDSDELENFVETALKNIRGELQSNLNEAQRMTDRFDEGSDGVTEVLAQENVREIQVRAEQFENPRVTVWLKDCPIWANHAWNDTIYPEGLNSYNGKVQTNFDVRPF